MHVSILTCIYKLYMYISHYDISRSCDTAWLLFNVVKMLCNSSLKCLIEDQIFQRLDPKVKYFKV